MLVFRGISPLQKPVKVERWPVISSAERLSHHCRLWSESFPMPMLLYKTIPRMDFQKQQTNTWLSSKKQNKRRLRYQIPKLKGTHGQHLHPPWKLKCIWKCPAALGQRSHKDRRTQYLGGRCFSVIESRKRTAKMGYQALICLKWLAFWDSRTQKQPKTLLKHSDLVGGFNPAEKY